jgi:hypothetical protein
MFRLFAILSGLASLAHAHDCTGADQEQKVFPGCLNKHCDKYGEELCANGSCVDIGDDPYFRCECDGDHQNLSPQNCVKRDPATIPPVASASCDNSPCGQNAQCTISGGKPFCFCPGPDGYLENVEFGTACTLASASCEMNTCGFNAKCYDISPGFECFCINGSKVPVGTDCLDSYLPAPCRVNSCDSHANCQMNYKDSVCKCIDGYDGTGVSGDCKTSTSSTSSSGVICTLASCGEGEQCSVEGGFIVCKCNGQPIVPGSGEGCF